MTGVGRKGEVALVIPAAALGEALRSFETCEFTGRVAGSSLLDLGLMEHMQGSLAVVEPDHS